jgi:hypothetical protein
MDDPPPLSPIDPKEQAPLQIVPKTTRKRTVFSKHNYAKVFTIRERERNGLVNRATKIPASLHDGRARLLIIATKLMDRLERRLDLLGDADAQISTKEYKELMETIERCAEMMRGAFGMDDKPTNHGPQPVNNGVIMNGVPSAEMARLTSIIAAAATRKETNVTPQ